MAPDAASDSFVIHRYELMNDCLPVVKRGNATLVSDHVRHGWNTSINNRWGPLILAEVFDAADAADASIAWLIGPLLDEIRREIGSTTASAYTDNDQQ